MCSQYMKYSRPGFGLIRLVSCSFQTRTADMRNQGLLVLLRTCHHESSDSRPSLCPESPGATTSWATQHHIWVIRDRNGCYRDRWIFPSICHQTKSFCKAPKRSLVFDPKYPRLRARQRLANLSHVCPVTAEGDELLLTCCESGLLQVVHVLRKCLYHEQKLVTVISFLFFLLEDTVKV